MYVVIMMLSCGVAICRVNSKHQSVQCSADPPRLPILYAMRC